MPRRIGKQILKSLSHWGIQHVMPEEERSVPTGKSFDLDGLCLVGKVGTPLSFLRDRRCSDDDLVVFAHHRDVPKFTAGKQNFVLGSDKYGSGEECLRSGLLGNGRDRFFCFGQLGGYNLYCSMEPEERDSFWNDLLIPSVEKAVPDRARTGEAHREDDKYHLGREASFIFLQSLKRLASADGAWRSSTTCALRLGQKSTAWPPGKSPFECTFGPCESNFDLAGVDSVFWSAGCNLIFEGEDGNYASFWKTDFLEDELRGDGQSRTGSLYKLLGTDALSSCQMKGAPPCSFVKTWRKIRSTVFKSHRESLDCFDLESFQFYSTFIYHFKGSRGGKVTCDPSSPAWRERASSLCWVKRGCFSASPEDDGADPLETFVGLVRSIPPDCDAPLRVEPTLFLRFKPDCDVESKRGALKDAFENCWYSLGETYGDLATDPDSSLEVHGTCFWSTVLSRLACMAKLYKEVTEDIRKKAREGKANLAELEVLDFAEFSPYVWLTGKSWKVVPKVAEKLMVASASREGDFPCFPQDLFLPGGLRERMARQVIQLKPSGTPLPKPSRWLPDDSSLTRLPQAWFHSRKSPSTARFDKHVSLFLEYVAVLEDPRASAKRVVESFCLLFAFCCLTKAKSWAAAALPEDDSERFDSEESSF